MCCELPQVIAELLRFLKRSYWPFAWDSSADGGSSSGVNAALLAAPLDADVTPQPNSAAIDSGCSRGTQAGQSPSGALCRRTSEQLLHAYPRMLTVVVPSLAGGFTDAALCLLEGAESAELQAISRVAEHRLARGIWTSPGAGDLRRALAAAQRLAILVTVGLALAALPCKTLRVLVTSICHSCAMCQQPRACFHGAARHYAGGAIPAQPQQWCRHKHGAYETIDPE